MYNIVAVYTVKIFTKHKNMDYGIWNMEYGQGSSYTTDIINH